MFSTLTKNVDITKISDNKKTSSKSKKSTTTTTDKKNTEKDTKKTDKKQQTKSKKQDKKAIKDKERHYQYAEDDEDGDDDDEDYLSEDIEDTEDEEDSDDDNEFSETDDDEEGDSDDYETVSEDDEDEEPPKTPKKNKNKRFIIESDEDDEDDEEEGEVSTHKLRKTIGEIFPSKYMKDRVENTPKPEKKSEKKSEKSDKSSKKTSKSSKKSSKNEDDEDDDDEDEDEKDEKEKPGVFSFMLSLGDDGDDEDYETEEDEYKEDDNEECDSDDEKKFMKERYLKLEIPEDIAKKERLEKKRERRNKKKASSKKHNKTPPEEDPSSNSIEEEYVELLDTKKQLIEQLNKKPKNKVLRNAVDECNRSIKKLVQKTRVKNAKHYHKLIHSGKKPVNEIDYFKKNLSNIEQLHIMKDLKEINRTLNTEKPQRLTLLESSIPTKFKAIALQKLNLLRYMEPGDGEYFKIKNWVDTFMRIPFGFYKSLTVKMDDGVDVCHEFMERSMKTLDNCVYGLKDAKIQIMQLVGQWISNPGSIGTAIAIHGPPGCGKTSLVKEGISKILGREFAFIALGGTGDSSFLEGHSYTYEGSTCGRIVQILIESKSMNPVIYFDELDKISETPRGEEIANVLTHLTDTTQNSEFHDKYFSEFDFDLSKCLFIFSYNDESKVNPILKDRMYRIETKGYEVKEKIIIARNYLLPKIREHVKFSETDVVIGDDIIQYLVSNRKFTKEEAGVRNLKRCLEIIFTKLNLFRLTKPETNIFGKEIDLKVEFPFTVTRASVDALIKGEENQNQSLLAMYV